MFGNCVDVSYCQTEIDYTEIKAQGVDYVIIRDGYGKEASQKDSMFESHYKYARSAGLKIGAYHYSYATTIAEAVLEANICLQFIAGKQFDLPIFIDIEEPRIAAQTRQTVTDIVNAFGNVLQANGYEWGLYTSTSWLNNHLYPDKLQTDNLWVASWKSSTTKPYSTTAIWQYGGGDQNFIDNDGTLVGVRGYIDKDIVYKDYGYIKKRGLNGYGKPAQSDVSVRVANDCNTFMKAMEALIGTNGRAVCRGVGLDYIDNWCAYLISLAMNTCGFIGKYIRNIEGGAGSIARNSDGVLGDFFIKGDGVPQRGDIVMFRYEYWTFYMDKDDYFSDHVGVVSEYNEKDGTLITIEGNVDGESGNFASTSTCRYKYHNIKDLSVHAFYRPRWQVITIDNTTGDKTVENKQRVKKNQGVEIYQLTSSSAANYDVVVTAESGLNIRQGASTGYKILGAVPYNTRLHVSRTTGGGGYMWGLIEYQGKTGWVALNYTKTATTIMTYTVQAGDTLTSIAKKYNTTVAKILAINDIQNPDLIYGGQKIRIK